MARLSEFVDQALLDSFMPQDDMPEEALVNVDDEEVEEMQTLMAQSPRLLIMEKPKRGPLRLADRNVITPDPGETRDEMMDRANHQVMLMNMHRASHEPTIVLYDLNKKAIAK